MIDSSRSAASLAPESLGIRQIITVTEESADQANARALVAVVIHNPLALTAEENLDSLLQIGGQIAQFLARRASALMPAESITEIGRAAMVGQDGEIEHASALVGPLFATAIRQAYGEWHPLAPSVKKLGGPGVILPITLDPMASSGSAEELATYQMIPFELRVSGHPRDDEAIVVLVVGRRGKA